MNTIKLSDVTMKQVVDGFALSFKEKIELAKLLDKLGVSVIELEGIANARIDSLRIKSVAAAVVNSVIAVPVQLTSDSPAQVWAALQQAKSPRLQVCGAVSAVQMEYLYHKKPEAMRKAIVDTIAACKALCNDVEFLAGFSSHKRTADFAGLIAYDDNDVEVFTFGQHKGRSVEAVFRERRTYYDWMMNSNFPAYTKKVLTEIYLRTKTK